MPVNDATSRPHARRFPAIEAGHYEETRTRLTDDPIVVAMAGGLAGVPLAQLQHDDGTPRFEFMQAANAEYRQRGGTDGGHIGGIAEALLRLVVR